MNGPDSNREAREPDSPGPSPSIPILRPRGFRRAARDTFQLWKATPIAWIAAIGTPLAALAIYGRGAFDDAIVSLVTGTAAVVLAWLVAVVVEWWRQPNRALSEERTRRQEVARQLRTTTKSLQSVTEAAEKVASLAELQKDRIAQLEKALEDQRAATERLYREKVSRLQVAKFRLRARATNLRTLANNGSVDSYIVDPVIEACEVDLARILGDYAADDFKAHLPRFNPVMFRELDSAGNHLRTRTVCDCRPLVRTADWLLQRTELLTEHDLHPGFPENMTDST